MNPTKGSKLEKAVNYAQNHKDTLQGYLKDGRCELSNNRAERNAKSYAIGRKNSLFHASVNGAVASSVIYSLVETAKANMKKASAELDFQAAARFRDEMWALQQYLKVWRDGDGEA